MRTLLIYLSFWGAAVWFASQPVYYFIIGREVANLPPHLRMTSGDSEDGCRSFAKHWNAAFHPSSAYCEQVPRWQHWGNAIRNVRKQIADYQISK